MRKFSCMLLGLFICSYWVSAVLAAEPIIYPKEKQTSEQMEKDKSECHRRIRRRTAAGVHGRQGGDRVLRAFFLA